MMLFIFHIIQCFAFTTVQSIKFNGSCPVLPAEDRFNCNDLIGVSVSLWDDKDKTNPNKLVSGYRHEN